MKNQSVRRADSLLLNVAHDVKMSGIVKGKKASLPLFTQGPTVGNDSMSIRLSIPVYSSCSLYQFHIIIAIAHLFVVFASATCFRFPNGY